MKYVLALCFLISPSPPAVQDWSSVTKVTVDNECLNTEVKFLAETRKEIISAPSVTTHQLKSTPSASYPLVICTSTQCFRYGSMTFLPDRSYTVKITRCNFPAVRIESHEAVAKKSNAAPMLRFRSAYRKNVEYRCGQTPYRRLGVGLTRYRAIKWPIDPPGTRIQFRYRMVPSGPVEYMSIHNVTKFNPGHRYFVEVGYFGAQKEYLKIQDEGEIPPAVKERKD